MSEDYDKWARLRQRLGEESRNKALRAGQVLDLMDELEAAERFWRVASQPVSPEARERARQLPPRRLPRREQGSE